MSSRRILVTGGTGYLGSTLVPLLARYYKVTVLCTMDFGNAIVGTPNVRFVKGDINDKDALNRAIAGCTDVCHLAAIVTDELVDMNPYYGQKVNLEGTMNVLEAIRTHPTIKTLVYASSGSVYGTQDGICTEETEPKPMTVYAKTKLAAERLCLSAVTDNLRVFALRMATCAGPSPRMRFDTIVNIFCKQAWWNGKITVFDGRQSRSNVHVKDAAEAYYVMLNAPAKLRLGLYNVVRAQDKATAIAETVQRVVLKETGKLVPIEVDTSKVDLRHYKLSGEKIKNDFGWAPSKTIEEAVQDNIKWFKDGHIPDPEASVLYNNRHMPHIVASGGVR